MGRLTPRIDNSAERFREFLGWLLSKKRQADMPGGGRTFTCRTAEFWRIWPLPPVNSEACRVVLVDSIYPDGKARVLIAGSEAHVLGRYVAGNESSEAYGRSWP